MAFDTGNGSTLAFTGQTGTYAFRRISGFSESLVDIEISDLSTQNHEKFMIGDIAQHERLECDVIYDASVIANRIVLEDTTALGTVTLTFAPASTGALTITGTGLLVSRTLPELVNNELMMQSVMIRMEGGTSGITFGAVA